jgi:hypothetical protein
VHELGSAEARRQLELLLMRGPEELRFVLAMICPELSGQRICS